MPQSGGMHDISRQTDLFQGDRKYIGVALLNEHDVARVCGMSLASVRRWRLIGEGPKYIKIGAAVRYQPEDLTQWIESRPTGGGNQEDR